MAENEIKGTQVEHSTPGTPEQNGVVERAFSQLYNKIRAIMNDAGFREDLRQLLWDECANTVVTIDNILINTRPDQQIQVIFIFKKPRQSSLKT